MLFCIDNAGGQRTYRRRRRPQRRQRTQRVQRDRLSQRDTRLKNEVEFKLTYDLSIQAVPSQLKFIAPIPQTIPARQEISEIQYSPEPARFFEQNGVTYAEFAFTKPPNQLRLQINVKATLFRYDLATAKKRQNEDEPNAPDLRPFLKNEKFIEKTDPEIQKIAESMPDVNQIELVRHIYDYTTNYMNYVYSTQEVGALGALRKKEGACTDYCDLFVALCRAKDIPSRVVKGYISESLDTPKHAWAEVHLEKYGWVPFDLTYGDVEQSSIRSERFENLRPIYVYLTNIRNDEVLDKAILMTGYSVGDVQVNLSVEFK
jgi:transglutaminase-like putative cysteine protease